MRKILKHRGSTHYCCNEILKRDGGKAIGCCCTGHECKREMITDGKPLKDFTKEQRKALVTNHLEEK